MAEPDARMGSEAPRPPWYADPLIRSYIIQILVFLGIIALGFYLVLTARYNLEKQGIASGFGFWFKNAGFDIGFHLIDFSAENSYGRAVLVGLYNTILVAVIGIIIATIVGFLVGIARLSNNWLVSSLATVYVEVLRNTPLLLQLFFWYFAVLASLPSAREPLSLFDTIFFSVGGITAPLPVQEPNFIWVIAAFVAAIIASIIISMLANQYRIKTGRIIPAGWISLALIIGAPIAAYFYFGQPLQFEYPEQGRFRLSGGMTLVPEFVALLLGLSLYTGSFIAENVRAGILSVSKGQWEASDALGLKRGSTLRLIVIPQAMRVIIPPQTNQYLNLTKNSSLGVAIGYPELVSVGGTVLNQTGQAVEMISIMMLFYVSLSIFTSILMNWYNKRIALVER